jgi:hypothetical protein
MATKVDRRVFSNDEHRLQSLESEFSANLQGRPFAVVWICNNELSGSTKFGIPLDSTFTRILLVLKAGLSPWMP